MKVVVPIAGRGSRFLEVADSNPEYKKPKPLINIKGKPMVVWALESLPFVDLPHRPAQTSRSVRSKDLVFICRQDHEDDHQISQILKEAFGENINIILIGQITRGAAETALKAKGFINSEEEIIVSDSDHYFDGRFLYEKIAHKDAETVGIIPVWQPPDKEPKWSYSLVEVEDNIKTVKEKDKELAEMGAYANIGGYYFSSGKVFVDEVEEMVAKNEMFGSEGKKEFYVAPVYDRLIKKGRKVVAAITPKVWGLGTPKDVNYFTSNFETSSG